MDSDKDHQPLPPVYLSDDPLSEDIKNKPIMCKVHINKTKMVKMVKCEAEDTAETFADSFVKKINMAHNFNRKKEDWIFKAQGTAEYLYGNHQMIVCCHVPCNFIIGI